MRAATLASVVAISGSPPVASLPNRPQLPDTGGLLRLASALEHQAADVRAEAAGLMATAEATVWQSTAATACRARVAWLAGQDRQLANELEAVARTVRRHAGVVTDRSAQALRLALAGVQQAITGLTGRPP